MGEGFFFAFARSVRAAAAALEAFEISFAAGVDGLAGGLRSPRLFQFAQHRAQAGIDIAFHLPFFCFFASTA